MNTALTESIILRHSGRGMDKLQEFLPYNFCQEAAAYIASWPKGIIFLTTGFYVAGFAETDGPLGTMALAYALKKCGYDPYIITDEYCRNYFEEDIEHIIYAPVSAPSSYYESLIQTYQPVGMISIERCGKNTYNDYANMRGISIKEHTAAIDELFLLAPKFHIPTVGVGDGGNEIGMGNLATEISQKLSLVPCTICVDKLVVATVSNWGCYGLIHYLEEISQMKLLKSYDEIKAYLEKIVSYGCVDGVSKESTLSIDGFSLSIEEEILNALS